MLLANGTQGQVKAVAVNPTVNLNPGTSSTAPGISITVGGFTSNGGIYQEITTASTSVYGVTKLSSTSSSSEEGVAATPKGVWDAINTLDKSDISGFGAGKTLATLTETDGIIAQLQCESSHGKSSCGICPGRITCPSNPSSLIADLTPSIHA